METVSRKSVMGRFVRFGLVGLAVGVMGLTALVSTGASRASAATYNDCNLDNTPQDATAFSDMHTHLITVYPCAQVLPGYEHTGQYVQYQVVTRDVTNATPGNWVYHGFTKWYFIGPWACRTTGEAALWNIFGCVEYPADSRLPAQSMTGIAGHKYEMWVYVQYYTGNNTYSSFWVHDFGCNVQAYYRGTNIPYTLQPSSCWT
jgi:hypothetical protein